jgi:hypothetical protein
MGFGGEAGAALRRLAAFALGTTALTGLALLVGGPSLAATTFPAILPGSEDDRASPIHAW